MNHFFNNVVLRKPWLYFIYSLVALNFLMMFLYFSGSAFLQKVIVPEMTGLHRLSWREFGLPEVIQNLLLITIIVIFIYALKTKEKWFDKALYFVGLILFTFLFLEEIDYGLHYYEFLTGDLIEGRPRNFHNQSSGDGQYAHVRKIKQITDGAIILLFVILPLLSYIKIDGKRVIRYAFVPVGYFVYAVVCATVLSKAAHYLDDAGLSVINGEPGRLTHDISEFRETSTYYIYLLYLCQLVSYPSLFTKRD